jgi:hypothetical protein
LTVRVDKGKIIARRKFQEDLLHEAGASELKDAPIFFGKEVRENVRKVETKIARGNTGRD